MKEQFRILKSLREKFEDKEKFKEHLNLFHKLCVSNGKGKKEGSLRKFIKKLPIKNYEIVTNQRYWSLKIILHKVVIYNFGNVDVVRAYLNLLFEYSLKHQLIENKEYKGKTNYIRFNHRSGFGR